MRGRGGSSVFRVVDSVVVPVAIPCCIGPSEIRINNNDVANETDESSYGDDDDDDDNG